MILAKEVEGSTATTQNIPMKDREVKIKEAHGGAHESVKPVDPFWENGKSLGLVPSSGVPFPARDRLSFNGASNKDLVSGAPSSRVLLGQGRTALQRPSDS